MNKTAFHPRFFLIITLLLSSGCSSTKETSFLEEVQPEVRSLNKEIRVSIPTEYDVNSKEFVGKDDLRYGDVITIQVDNLTQDLIRFSSENGLKIFTYDSKQKKWIGLEDTLVHLPVTPYQSLYPKGVGDSFGFTTIIIKPDLSSIPAPAKIRVLLIGDVIHDEEYTGSRAGGYLDITLKP